LRLVVHDAPIAVVLVATQEWHHDGNSVAIKATLHYEQPQECRSEKKLAMRLTLIDARDGSTILAGGDDVVGPFQSRSLVTDGSVAAEIKVKVANEAKWWPRGYGAQPLHILRAELIEEGTAEPVLVCTRRIGLRKVELIRGRTGKGFCFVVNGVPVYCLGVNWVPIDLHHGRITDAHVRHLLNMSAAANMNSIRVWGGGSYESDYFYDVCDELGLLVWQDMPFSCSCYPATPEFLESVRQEVTWQVRRLASHASLVLWCGNNEIEEGMPFKCELRPEYHREYLALFRDTIWPTVRREDPTTPFVRSSPSRCVVDGPFDEKAGEIDDGDSHFWGLWHGTNPADIAQVLQVQPRFCSEFGFQSLPSVSSLLSELRGTDVASRGIFSDALSQRQRSWKGREKLVEAMYQLLPASRRSPFGVESLGLAGQVFLTQCYQAIAVCTAIDHMRRLFPVCTGCLFWQFNDVWTAPSWSCIGSDAVPKMLYYCAARSFAPVTISGAVLKDGAGAAIWLSNTTLKPVCGRIILRIVRVCDGEVVTTATA
jgi:beta-mannosidase